jgi:hypothetical protein
MRTRGRAVAPLLALSFLMATAVGSSSFADTPPQQKGAREAKAKPQSDQPVPATPGKAKTNAARKAAEARIARCRLHPEICVQ